jgi:hypothetical protein
MNIQKLIMTPMSGDEMLSYNPDARLCKYTDLINFNNIDDLFGHYDKIILLYLIDSPYSGHWTGLIRNRYNNEIDFFDSYGLNIDSELNYLTKEEKEHLHEKYKTLSKLLKESTYNINHNEHKLQGKTSQTCGRFVSLRLLNHMMDNNEFVDLYFVDTNKTPDEIVCEFII